LYGLLYEVGVTSLETALQNIYSLFTNVSLSKFRQTFRSIKLIPDVSLVIQQLNHLGYEIAFISSGIPDLLVRELAQQLNVRYAVGLGLEVFNNKLTGQISGDVIRTQGKALVLKQLLNRSQISTENCFLVVDDRNNLSMFPLANITIGYNPDPFIARKCDYAIKGNLKDILPFLIPSENSPSYLYTRNDAIREAIHMGSYSIPFICHIFQVNPNGIALSIIFCTILFFVSELLRLSDIRFPIISQITEAAATGEERWEFALSPVFFALSIAISLTLFSPEIGYTAIAILTLGDGTARFVGKKWGRHTIPHNRVKKIEGTIAGIAVASVASIIFTSPLNAVTVSTICMIIETIPLPFNDNIMIPLTAWITMLGLS
jgi:phosphoserine phosphatase/dolichol kinase